MKQQASQLLFVYGSLRPDVDDPMSEKLSGESQVVGPATIPGALYQVHNYPGLKYDPDSETTVKGYLVSISDPESFGWLDLYEGYNPENPEGSLFLRQKATALHEGDLRQCWIYEYAETPIPESVIPEGDWLAWLEEEGLV